MKRNVMGNLNTIGQSSTAIETLQELFPNIDIKATFEEVAAEWNKNRAKSEANAKIYAEAKAPVFAVMSDTPMTVKEIFAAAGETLPEGITANKIQWALLNPWRDEIVVTENGKNPNTYSIK